MAVGTGYSFSFAPKPQTALAQLQPLTFDGGIKYERLAPVEFRDQNLEAVSTGHYAGRQKFVEGIMGGALSGLGSVTDAYVSKRQKEIDKADAERLAEKEHERAIEIANIRAKKDPLDERKEQLDIAYREKQLEKLNQDVEERLDDTLPTETRKQGYWQGRESSPNFTRPVDEVPSGKVPLSPKPAPQPSSGFEIDIPEPFASEPLTNAIDIPEPFAGKSLSNLTPPAVEKNFEPPVLIPAGTGEKLSLNGVDLSLNQVTGQPAQMPMQQALLVEPPLPEITTTKPQKTLEAQPQAFTRYEMENYFAGQPYESLPDAKYAADQLKNLGYTTKIVTDGTGKSKIFYIEYERPDEAQAPLSSTIAPEGFYTKEMRDVDGKITKVFLPKIEPKQQLRTLISAAEKLDTLDRAITEIETLVPGILGLGGQGAGGMSWLMSKAPWSNDAKTVRGLLETVRGIIGFDELVALKAAGGTLGALSENELIMLQALRGSLNPDLLSEDAFLNNLESIKQSTKRLKQGLLEDQRNLVENVERGQGFQPIQSSEDRKKITSKEEWEALKPGQKYDWNGRPGTKK